MELSSPVQASLTFLSSSQTGEDSTTEDAVVYVPSVAGVEKSLDQTIGGSSNTTVQQVVPVYNARTVMTKPPTLNKEGFCLVHQDVSDIDLYDDEQIVQAYHPQIKELLLQHVQGAPKRVEIFDDTRRSALAQTRVEQKMREPSATVHNDYTERSGLWRLRTYWETMYPEENVDQEVLAKYDRFVVINVWRSLRGPIVNWPLVMCDASTVEADDVVAVERRSAQRRGEIQMAVSHPQRHKWYYYPQMQPNEAILLQTFDSTQPCRTIHSSFDDPTAPTHAPPRESIETRCFVFF